MQQLVQDEQYLLTLEYTNISARSNFIPRSLAATTEATVLGLAPNVSIEPSIIHANIGDMVQFHCNILEGTKENVTVFWRKKNSASDLDLGIINSSTLTIGPITKKHEGEYHCIVTNAIGKGGDKATLVVHEDGESFGKQSRNL